MSRAARDGADPTAGPVLAAIAAGDIAPVYVLYGDEPAAIHAVLEALRAAVLTPGFEAFNHERLEGRALDAVAPVLEACAQLPTLAERRLVELSDPDQVGEKSGRTGDALAEAGKRAIDGLLAYLEDPNPTTVLVLTGRGLDGRSRIVTAAKKVGVVHRFGRLSRDADAVGFLRGQARARGIELAGDAAEAIVAAVGLGQTELLDGLERASLHAGSARVTIDDVEAVVSHTREAVVFELTDAVGLGDRGRALRVLERIFAERAMPESAQALALVGMLARQIRLVWVARNAGARTAEAAGVPPFVARKLQAQARRMDEGRLRLAHAGLARLDLDLKGGSGLEPRILLERFVLDVCGGLPGAEPRV